MNNNVLIFDPDWGTADPAGALEVLRTIPRPESIIYANPADLRMCRGLWGMESIEIRFSEVLLHYSELQKISDFPWKLSENLSEVHAFRSSGLNLFEIAYEYVASMIINFLKRGFLLDYARHELQAERIFVVHNGIHAWSRLETVLPIPVEPIAIHDQDGGQGTGAGRPAARKNLIRFGLALILNTLNMFRLKANTRRILYQDHRNTSPLIQYLGSRNKRIKGFKLGASLGTARGENQVSLEPNLFLRLSRLSLPGRVRSSNTAALEGFLEKMASSITGEFKLDQGPAHALLQSRLSEFQQQILAMGSMARYLRRLLRTCRPDLIFLNNYSSDRQKALICLGKEFNIKSAVCEHGMFNEIRYRNDRLDMDMYGAWGQITGRKFKRPAREGQIEGLGNFLYPEEPPDTGMQRKGIMIATPSYKPFRSNRISEFFWTPFQGEFIGYMEFSFVEELVSELCTLGLPVHIQVHPSQEINKWKAHFGQKQITLSQRDAYRQLPKNDILILSNSTLGLDALYHGLELIEFDVLGSGLFPELYTNYHQFGVSHLCNSVQGVIEKIMFIRSGEGIGYDTRMEYLNGLIEAGSDNASENWSNAINRLLLNEHNVNQSQGDK